MKCRTTKKVCVGSTSRHAKERSEEHSSAMETCHKTGVSSTSVAEHFALTLCNFTPKELSHKIIRGNIECSILWRGKPLACVQTFGTPACRLCNRERLEIHKRGKLKPETLINKRKNPFESCNHVPKFHRHKEEPCTDEARRSRKGQAESHHRALLDVQAEDQCIFYC